MMTDDLCANEIRQSAAKITQNYADYDVQVYGASLRLPEKYAVIEVLHDLQKLFFPAYFGDPVMSLLPSEQYCSMLMEQIHTKLFRQIMLAFKENDENAAEAQRTCRHIISKLPEIQKRLGKDLAANFEGDPAAQSKEEVLFSYPGFYAIFIYRVAHELYLQKVPLIPRMMTEYAHAQTGIDINPGAVIGDSFFIDHGTGIVIGETTIIGDRVMIYQGVTLGALSPRAGRVKKGLKRHPTVGNDVTIYSGATILGGDTIIGNNVVIGGNVFLTESVPDNTKVTQKSVELEYKGMQDG